MNSKKREKLGVFILFVCVFAQITFNALTISQYIDFYPINGDFQSFNPLRRLDAGQIIGKEAVVYLGLGLTKTAHLFYSLVRQFGFEPLNASYFTFYFLAPIIFVFVSFFILFLNGTKTLTASIIIGFLLLIPDVSSLSTPGNSLLIFRCGAAVLSALVMLKSNVINLSFRKIIFISVITGFLILWSPDYGIPAFLSTGAMLFFILLDDKRKLLDFFISLSTFAFVSLLSAYIFGCFFTKNNFTLYLNYLNGVRSDQLWYFLSGWLTDSKIFELKDIPFLWLTIPGFALVLLSWVPFSKNKIFSKLRKLFLPVNKTHSFLFGFILLCFILGGYLPQVGGHISTRYFYFLILFYSLFFISLAIRFFSSHLSHDLKKVFSVVFLLLAGYGNAYLCFEVKGFYNPKNFYYDSGLKTHLSNQYKSAINVADMIREETSDLPENKRYFSTYSTIINHSLGLFNPSGSDYIIHALGPERRVGYVNQFVENAPMYAAVVNQEFLTWGKWNKRMDWDFYRHLYLNYRLTDELWYQQIFKRRERPITSEQYPIQVRIAQEPEDDEIVLELNIAGLAKEKGRFLGEMDIDFSVTRPKSILPIIGNRTYVQVEEGIVLANGRYKTVVKYGLNPNAKKIAFEVYEDTKRLFLRFKSFPQENSKLRLKFANARTFYFPDKHKENVRYRDEHLEAVIVARKSQAERRASH